MFLCQVFFYAFVLDTSQLLQNIAVVEICLFYAKCVSMSRVHSYNKPIRDIQLTVHVNVTNRKQEPLLHLDIFLKIGEKRVILFMRTLRTVLVIPDLSQFLIYTTINLKNKQCPLPVSIFQKPMLYQIDSFNFDPDSCLDLKESYQCARYTTCENV